jgi:hypothetical protein
MTKIINLIAILLLIGACSKKESLGPNATGKGGSTARFTIANNYLYIVDNQSLRGFNIQNPIDPIFVKKINLNTVVETIFPYKNNLLIGTQTGMYIFDIKYPEIPQLLSIYEHIRSCDPVVAENDVAYVTLRSGNNCNRGQNLLDVIDIKDLRNPKIISSYPMSSPHGLGSDSNLLFVTEGAGGLVVFDTTDSKNLKEIMRFKGFEAVDVIPENNTLIITGADGIYQYDYSDSKNLKLLSKILKE